MRAPLEPVRPHELAQLPSDRPTPMQEWIAAERRRTVTIPLATGGVMATVLLVLAVAVMIMAAGR